MSGHTKTTGHRANRRAILKTMLAPEHSAGQDAPVAVNDDIVAALDRAPLLQMQFHGTTADECNAWQATIRQKLNELLGDSTPPRDWRVVEKKRSEFPHHVRYELLMQAEAVPSMPLYLLVPKGLTNGQKAPEFVCLHGHGTFGHNLLVGRHDIAGIDELNDEYHADYAHQFVRRAYDVAAPCMIPFGRRIDESKYGSKYGGESACAVAFARMQALGQLLITENLRDVRWTIDLLQQRPEFIPDRIGCAGLSYRGHMTMLTAAIDDRIRVAAVSGALNLLQERLSARFSCGSQIIPRLAQVRRLLRIRFTDCAQTVCLGSRFDRSTDRSSMGRSFSTSTATSLSSSRRCRATSIRQIRRSTCLE